MIKLISFCPENSRNTLHQGKEEIENDRLPPLCLIHTQRARLSQFNCGTDCVEDLPCCGKSRHHTFYLAITAHSSLLPIVFPLA